jgi:hypothetical protein
MRRTTALASTAAALVAGAFAIGAAGAHAAATSAQTPTGGAGAVGEATSSPTPTSTSASTPTTPTPVSTPTATPTSTPVTTPTAKPTPPPPLFATPEAAMAYMARAFDERDIAALKKVTTPQSRQELFDMWPGQVHLRLSRCEKDGDSYAYVCFFPHDPPKGMDPTAVPEAVMVVEPAARPGWYMSELSECG